MVQKGRKKGGGDRVIHVGLTRSLPLLERPEVAPPDTRLSIVLLDCDGVSRLDWPCTEESGDHADRSGGEQAP